MGIPGSAQYERMVSHREGVEPFFKWENRV